MVVEPRRKAWKWYTAVPAVLLSLPLFWWARIEDRWTLQVEMVDGAGKPVPGVQVEKAFRLGPEDDDRYAYSDQEGMVVFHFKDAGSATMQLFSELPEGERAAREHNQWWDLTVTPYVGEDEHYKIWYKWQRYAGTSQLNGFFVEKVPRTRVFRLVVQLRPTGSMEPLLLREKIRAGLVARRHAEHFDHDYTALCMNLESVEFLPLLLETYRENEKSRPSVIQGIKLVAETLKDVDRGCRGLAKTIQSDPAHPISPAMAYRVDQMCRWAGVPYETGQDPLVALQAAELAIAARARPLVDFCLSDPEGTHPPLYLLDDLGPLARPAIPAVVQRALASNPRSSREASQCGSCLGKIGVTDQDLAPLLAADNPWLVMMAGEVICEADLHSAIAATAVQRLEALKPRLTDQSDRDSADRLVARLRER